MKLSSLEVFSAHFNNFFVSIFSGEFDFWLETVLFELAKMMMGDVAWLVLTVWWLALPPHSACRHLVIMAVLSLANTFKVVRFNQPVRQRSSMERFKIQSTVIQEHDPYLKAKFRVISTKQGLIYCETLTPFPSQVRLAMKWSGLYRYCGITRSYGFAKRFHCVWVCGLGVVEKRGWPWSSDEERLTEQFGKLYW